MKQLQIDFDKGIIDLPKVGPLRKDYSAFGECSNLMEAMDLLNKRAEEDNNIIQKLIDDLNERFKDKLTQAPEIIKPDMKELCSEAIDTLKKCSIKNMIVSLPAGQLDRKVYLEVKNKLELIGGKWKGGKVQGFVFTEDPRQLLEEVSNGASKNLKKEFQFFATPESLADQLVEMASVDTGHKILEPSAGQGAIVKSINKILPGKTVHCFELMPVNKTILCKIETVKLIGDDFLCAVDRFDRIIANPPFSKNQDIDHIRKMYELLLPNGRLVAISSTHWQISNNKKEKRFSEWLKEIGATITQIAPGAFKESGTTVAGLILVIDKKAND